MDTFDFSFYKGKKVLVTGHTGFKGSWLCRLLLKLGAEVTGYALEPPTQPDLFQLLDVESQMHSVTGDIRDLEKLKQVFAEAQPEDRRTEPGDYYRALEFYAENADDEALKNLMKAMYHYNNAAIEYFYFFS